MDNTLIVLILPYLVTYYSLGSIQNFNYEELQQTNVHLYCKSVPSSSIMLRCLAEGRSGWVVGYNQEQCLVCYFDGIEPEFKLFNGSKESLLWMTQTSKFSQTIMTMVISSIAQKIYNINVLYNLSER